MLYLVLVSGSIFSNEVTFNIFYENKGIQGAKILLLMKYFSCFYTGDVTWVGWNEGIWSNSRDVICQVHWLYFINDGECIWRWWHNTLMPIKDGRYFSDDLSKWIFLNENLWISIEISLTFVPRDPI